MSMVAKLKNHRLMKYLYIKKSGNNIFTDNNKKRKINLKKSNSFNIKTEPNNNNKAIPLISLKTPNNIKLRNNNKNLLLNLNKMQKELILAKSVQHKKNFELKKNEKLLTSAINIKRLALELEQETFFPANSVNIFQKERQDELIEESFKSNLLYKIKTKYFNQEKIYQNKLKEISDLKNNIKHCKNKDLEKQNQKLLNNFIQLKKNYDISISKNNEYKLKMQDYIELEDKLTKKNFCILELQESLKEITDANINIGNTIEELKLKLKLLEVENNNLNIQFDMLNENCNQVLINKREIENKYAILLNEEKPNNENNINTE